MTWTSWAVPMGDGSVQIPLRVQEDGDGHAALWSPEVGELWCRCAEGDAVGPGAVVALLTVLGRRLRLVVPEPLVGTVSWICPRASVGVGDRVATVRLWDGAARVLEASVPEASDDGGLFATPHAGRFYDRPSPGEMPFVAAGDRVESGTVVGLVEVMKTFHRIQFHGQGPVRVVRMHLTNGSEVKRGDVIFSHRPDQP